METWIWLIIGCSIAFVIGVYFTNISRTLSQIVSGGIRNLQKDHVYPFTEIRNAKVVATLFALLSISIASWTFNYYAKQQNLDPIWSGIATAVFGVSTAGLLGGIVFELFLRKEIISEVTETLAEIVTTDKNVARELFTQEKRNKIIETMLQLNIGNDLYGSALYSDFIAKFTDKSIGYNREFRFAFKDYVTFSDIDAQKYSDLAKDYFAVVDRISYRAELRPIDFIVGCASTEKQLYELFSDPACIYRWFLKTDKFEALMTSDSGFSASLTVGGIECEPINGEGKMGSRGFEIHFNNPFIGPKASRELNAKIGSLVDFQIEINTLHYRKEHLLSVHMAYPVKGAEIGFDYENSSIRGVTKLHFLTAGKHSPKIQTGVEPKWAPRHHKVLVTVSDDYWLFPDSGVVFVWQNEKLILTG